VAASEILPGSVKGSARRQDGLVAASFFSTSKQSVVACSGRLPSKARGWAASEGTGNAPYPDSGARAASNHLSGGDGFFFMNLSDIEWLLWYPLAPGIGCTASSRSPHASPWLKLLQKAAESHSRRIARVRCVLSTLWMKFEVKRLLFIGIFAPRCRGLRDELDLICSMIPTRFG
jgi:hypothetical protein